GPLRIAVRSELAKEWLDNRLRETVERTVSTVLGQPVSLAFEVVCPPPPEPALAPEEAPALPPAPLAVSPLAGLDYPHLWNDTGFSKLHHYHNIFWRRYLGRAFELWL